MTLKIKNYLIALPYLRSIYNFVKTFNKKEVLFIRPLFYHKKISLNISKKPLVLRLQQKISKIFTYIKELIDNKLASFLVILDKKRSYFQDLFLLKKIKYNTLFQFIKGCC